MRIRAIAVYDVVQEEKTKEESFKRTYVEQPKSLGFYSSVDLGKLEKTTLPRATEDGPLKSDTPYSDFAGDEDHREYHYFVKKQNKSKDGFILIAIVSETRLRDAEPNFLFMNINAVIRNTPSAKLSLQDFLVNPYGYTGKYRFSNIEAIQTRLDETRAIMRDNIDLVLKRGLKLEELEAKSNTLKLGAEKFKDKAHDQNSCWKQFSASCSII